MQSFSKHNSHLNYKHYCFPLDFVFNTDEFLDFNDDLKKFNITKSIYYFKGNINTEYCFVLLDKTLKYLLYNSKCDKNFKSNFNNFISVIQKMDVFF